MINIRKVKTYSVLKRKSKVEVRDFARPAAKGKTFFNFYRSLPNILKAKELRAVVDAIVGAKRGKKAVIFMAGAHVIKCGLNPILIELMKKNIITCICLNGAGIIHDFEIALQGRTSEDVGEGLEQGKFGMGRESADFINNAVNEGVFGGMGLGYSVARKLALAKLPYKNLSLLYNAYKKNIPVCVHVAMGTDIIHQHPSFDGARAGEGSIRDFYQLADIIRNLNQGGVILNFGSAVVLPEVFLKALNLARNLGFKVKNFTTVNFDMLYHYRPQENIVFRPVMAGGRGYYIIGHHEIMLPLLAQAILDRL